MDRLDQVLGSENWKVAYEFHGQTGVICNLSLKIGGEWITKQDGAEMTDIESFKGGISSALKRAGSAWGMGRYLYSLDAGFAQIVDKGTPGCHYGKTKENDVFYWTPPSLPSWALPNNSSNPAKLSNKPQNEPPPPAKGQSSAKQTKTQQEPVKDDSRCPVCNSKMMISQFNAAQWFCGACKNVKRKPYNFLRIVPNSPNQDDSLDDSGNIPF